MKKFITKLLLMLPILLLIIGINFKEDPANIFRRGPYEQGIVKYLNEGKNVTNVTNYDERLLQKYFINEMKDCPDVIILGSSRVMQLGNAYFPNEKLINNGVSGASIEDLLAIYDLYENKGCKIKKVKIGLDPYFLNENNDQSRWKLLANEYNEMLAKLGLSEYTEKTIMAESEVVKYKQLWSVSYFKSSWSYFIRGVDVHYRPTTEANNKDFTKLTDGSIIYGESSRNSSLETINRYATQSITETPMYSMREFTKISTKYQIILSQFIAYLQSKEVEVEFFISPYHPIVFDYIKKSKDYQIVFEVEKYFNQLADDRKIKLIGSYSPYTYNFIDSNFFDGFHCKGESLNMVFAKQNQIDSLK
ncbi:MAG: hypothetical protein PSX81_13620 [bacterium]|nr:hypothetical protein [bacterium]